MTPDFAKVMSYESRLEKNGTPRPTAEDVFDAIHARVRIGHCVGQAEHIRNACEWAELSTHTLND